MYRYELPGAFFDTQEEVSSMWPVLQEAYEMCIAISGELPSMDFLLEQVTEVLYNNDIVFSSHGDFGMIGNKEGALLYIEMMMMECKHAFIDSHGSIVNDAQEIIMEGMGNDKARKYYLKGVC